MVELYSKVRKREFTSSLWGASILVSLSATLVWLLLPRPDEETIPKNRSTPSRVTEAARWVGYDQIPDLRLQFPVSEHPRQWSTGQGVDSKSKEIETLFESKTRDLMVTPGAQVEVNRKARFVEAFGISSDLSTSLGSRGKGILGESRGNRSSESLRGLVSDLRNFETAYQTAVDGFLVDLSFSFSQPAIGNPFRLALLEQSSLDLGISSSMESSGETPAISELKKTLPVSESSAVEAPETMSEIQSGITVEESLHSGKFTAVSQEYQFDFIVIGDFGAGASSEQVYRAHRDRQGVFVLENDYSFQVMPQSDAVWIFEEEERVAVADLNQDGHLDIVRARNSPVGTNLESFLGNGSSQFERQAQGYLFHQQVLNLALFDFSGDGEAEIVLVTEQGSSLILYGRSHDRLLYLKELELPFPPGFVLASNLQLHDRLFVVDKTLRQIWMHSSRFHDGHFFPIDFPRDALHNLKLEGFGGEPKSSIFVFEDLGSFAVLEQTEKGIVLRGLFQQVRDLPLIIMGDYLRLQSTQVVFWW